MKTLIKTTLLAFLLITFSCSKDDSTDTPPQPEATVTNMSPTSGPKTTIVTFTGTNFGTDMSTVQVFFDNIEAAVQSVTDTEIKTLVPPRAFFGEVTIIINGTTFTDFNFNYEIIDIQVTTFVGSGTAGFADGDSNSAEFAFAADAVLDSAGNLFVADAFAIRKITPDGNVTTFAGSDTSGFADGIGVDARFNISRGITIDNDNNLYVSDTGNHKIRKITPAGVVSTLAGGNEQGFSDGSGIEAQFNSPIGIAIDASNNLYVADAANHKIRKIDTNNQVTTIAGSSSGFADGNAADAQFINPIYVAVDLLNNIYISDLGNDKIRKLNSNGQVTTVAGNTSGFADGTGAAAQFDNLNGLVVDADFNIYVADALNYKIRKITQE